MLLCCSELKNSLNFFGYFLSPILSGAVMQWSGGIEWGFRLCLWWGFVSVFGAVMLFFAARNRVAAAELRRAMQKLKTVMQAVPEDGRLPAPPGSEPAEESGSGGRSIPISELPVAYPVGTTAPGAAAPDGSSGGGGSGSGAGGSGGGRTLLSQLSDRADAVAAATARAKSAGAAAPFAQSDASDASASNPPVQLTVVASAGSDDGLEVR